MAREPVDATFTLTSLRADAVTVPALEVHAWAPDGRNVVAPLGMAPVVIGTSTECDLTVEDGHVSRRHCEFKLDDRGIAIRDLGSKNGTFVQGLRVVEAIVRPDLPVDVGSWRVVVRVTGDPHAVSLSTSARMGEAIGGTLIMRALFARLTHAATTDETVLLVGESGTGKELLARAVHDHSPRAHRPFVVFDCSAVAPTLIEAELFGYVRGAFTGADRDRAGILEQTEGGTLFFDEVGELPLDLQPKLLRALEARRFRRLGSNAWQAFDARIVAATHRDLAARMKAGEFRQDLYYRLAVLEARVPSLRERRDDIELLVERFLASRTPALTVHDLPAGSLAMLHAHDWPGNVRELKNTLARLLVFREADDALLNRGQPGMAKGPSDPMLELSLREARQQVIERFEDAYLRAQLEASAGNVTRAAAAAGVSRQFFHRLLERYKGRDK